MKKQSTKSLIFILCLYPSLTLGQADTCVGFTYGDCLFNDDDVISSYTLPGNPNAFVLCQDLCQSEDNCAYFKYDSLASTCLLYQAFDILACQTISGDTSPDVGECLPDPTSSECKDIRQVDCDFSGLDSVVVDDVLVPYECQDILRAIGTGFFSTYFVYRGEDLTCSLLTSAGRQCPTVIGPAYPDFETECTSVPTTTEAIGSLRLIVGLGYNTGHPDDFETISLETREHCANLPDYPDGGYSGPSSAVSGGILYVCGGYDGDLYTNTCYSFQNGEWVEEAPMEIARQYAAMAVAFDGTILISGGIMETGNVLTETTEFLDPESGTWSPGPDMPLPLYGHCLAAIDGGTRFFLTGGMADSSVSDRAFIYDLSDPDAGWMEVHPMPEERNHIDCMQIGNDIIVPGGDLADGTDVSTVVAYDILADVWRQTTSLPESRHGYRLVKFTNNDLYLVGGVHDIGNGVTYPTEIFEYNSQADSWTIADIELNTSRTGPVAEVLPEDSIHLPSC